MRGHLARLRRLEAAAPASSCRCRPERIDYRDAIALALEGASESPTCPRCEGERLAVVWVAMDDAHGFWWRSGDG
jgi:hypothetical protein